MFFVNWLHSLMVSYWFNLFTLFNFYSYFIVLLFFLIVKKNKVVKYLFDDNEVNNSLPLLNYNL